MGLPSGILWADRNIGAGSPSEDGEFFSWGNTLGHPADSLYNFSQDVYNTTPGAALTNDIPLSQDAARLNIGTPWRMPTDDECQELYDNCTSVWTTLNGIYGRLFTSIVNGKTLFLPAAGYYNSMSHIGYRQGGYYWTTSYDSDLKARTLYFGGSGVAPQTNSNRHFGFSVRAVASPSNLAQSLHSLSIHEHLTNDIRNEGLDIQPIEPIIDSVTE